MRQIIAELIVNRYVECDEELCELLLTYARMNRWFFEVKMRKQKLRSDRAEPDTPVWVEMMQELSAISQAAKDAAREFVEFIAAEPRHTRERWRERHDELVAVIRDCTTQLDAIPRRYGAD